jgi:WXG100 family type VII secretion target
VVPDELEAGATSIMAYAVQLDEDLDSLRARLLPVADFWQGQANVGWAELQAMWDRASTQLMTSVGTLGDLSRAVGVNWVNYVDTESANTRTWAH